MTYRHIDPTDPKFTAIAPYNFVPLPQKVLFVDEGLDVDGEKVKPWEQHDRFIPGLYSGYIDLHIKNLKPLYIRGPIRKSSNGQWDTRDTRFREEPFMTPEGKPVIPGSSLRGMLRTLYEILTFSKLDGVTNEKPFYRSVGNDRVGKLYRARMVPSNDKPLGGIIEKDGSDWFIRPCKTYRVPYYLIKQVNKPFNPNHVPDPRYQYKTCQIKIEGSYKVVAVELSGKKKSGSDWKSARLVLTGPANKKKAEFALVETGEAKIPVPEAMIERFNDDDQISQWQQKAFKGGRPNGGIRPNDAVFYRVDSNFKSEDNPKGVVFLGRAQMFRLPYDRSPYDLLPDDHKKDKLDMAQALFGYVGQKRGNTNQALKGRIVVEDAVADTKNFDSPFVPRILSSPKVTTFQHYLTQDSRTQNDKQGPKEQLTSYFKEDKTTLRGHKLYWHSNAEYKDKELKADQVRNNADTHTQQTIIKPVSEDTVFKGRIRFHNLTTCEVGALLTALNLPEECAHKLGMGKPLGLGSVKITPELKIINRTERYKNWKSAGEITYESSALFTDAFAKMISDHAKVNNETSIDQNTGLRQIARIDALFQILNWKNKPKDSKTRYMTIQNGDLKHFEEKNEYKNRPVLPSPYGVIQATAKPTEWKGDIPVAGKPPKIDPPKKKKDAGGSKHQSHAAKHTPQHKHPRPIPAQQKPKAIQQGQSDVPGKLVKSDNIWKAQFEGENKLAMILNLNNIPGNTTEGTVAYFFIQQKNKHSFKVRWMR